MRKTTMGVITAALISSGALVSSTALADPFFKDYVQISNKNNDELIMIVETGGLALKQGFRYGKYMFFPTIKKKSHISGTLKTPVMSFWLIPKRYFKSHGATGGCKYRIVRDNNMKTVNKNRISVLQHSAVGKVKCNFLNDEYAARVRIKF